MIGRPIEERRTPVVLRLLQGGVLLLPRELVLVLVAQHGAPHGPPAVPQEGGLSFLVILLDHVQHEVVVFVIVVVIRLEWSRR